MKTIPWLLIAGILGAWGIGVLPIRASWSKEPQTLMDVIENSLGMRFVLIPAGEFLMGNHADPDEMAADFPHYELTRLQKLSDEKPVHRIRVSKRFYLGQYEVTVGQFRQFIEQSGYQVESEADGTGGYGFNPAYDSAKSSRGDAFEGRDPRYSWHNTGFTQTDEHPVFNVTWNDANALALWLTQREGVRYRLPTEAEWEYACRAGTTTHFYNGNQSRALDQIANTFDIATSAHWPQWHGYAESRHDGYAFSAPVGHFQPNAYGLHDMIGNAWEWVSDWYGEDYYQTSPVDDPKGPTTGVVRVRRGGSWHTWPLYARCSFRNWNTPQTRYTLVGIRLLREAPQD